MPDRLPEVVLLASRGSPRRSSKSSISGSLLLSQKNPMPSRSPQGDGVHARTAASVPVDLEAVVPIGQPADGMARVDEELLENPTAPVALLVGKR